MKNKVYLVSFEYFPICQAGLARHAKAVIDRLLKYNNFKAIIAIPKNYEIRLSKNIISIPCVFFDNKYLANLEFSLKVFFRLKSRLNIDSFVIFSSYSYFMLPVLPKIFYLFVHSNQKRIYLTNYPGENIKDRLIRKFLYFFNYHWESCLCKKAKKVFSVSTTLKKETICQYRVNKNKIVVINNGLDKNIFKKSYIIKKQIKNLLYVGKIFPRKNLIDLITIFNLITNIDPEFKLHILGNGEINYVNKIKSIVIRLNLEKKVIFHEYISDYYLNKLYEKSDLFVSTSLVEGFGLVLLEAMSKGLPVVAYENLGFNDIIINGENGYLVKQGNHNDFVNKILFLSKNKKTYQKMSENALKRVDDFSWDTSVSKLIKEL